MIQKAYADRTGVRRAYTEDAAAIAKAHRNCFNDAWDESFLSALFGTNGVFGFVAENDGAALGFVLARCVADEGEILTLGVVPGHRRRRIGVALLDVAIDEATERGAEFLFLEVDATDGAANRFYDGQGFRRVGGRRDYYPRPEGNVDAAIMRRQLDRRA